MRVVSISQKERKRAQSQEKNINQNIKFQIWLPHALNSSFSQLSWSFSLVSTEICHANKLLLLCPWNEWDTKNASSMLYKHSWLKEWSEHVYVSVSVLVALGDLSPDSPPLQGAQGPPSACISQRAAAAAAAPLLGYHVRSLLICVRLRSSLLSSINHTTFTLQLWPTLTVNALCKSNQLSSKSPSSEWLNAVRWQPTHTGDTFLLRSQLKPAALINPPVSSPPRQLLPAHCLVGELSHSVELLLHLVCVCFFSALPPGGTASPHYLIDGIKSDLRADLWQSRRVSL